MSEKPLHHQTPIVKIKGIRQHTNADNLELVDIEGYQAVSRKGTFVEGQLAVYIYPDSVVPQTEPFHFIWGPHVDFSKVENPVADPAGYAFPVPEKRRRITVKKLRGEWSEGLLLPLSDFGLMPTRTGDGRSIISIVDLADFRAGVKTFYEGSDLSDFLGITHWNPEAETADTTGLNTHGPKVKRRYPRTIKGWLKFLWRWFKGKDQSYSVNFQAPAYDVTALKASRHSFTEGDPVRVTEKIHGSNARYVYLDGVMYAGSRNLWKAPDSNCVWRRALKANPDITEWCEAHPGYVLYGEVTPTQKGYDYGSLAEYPDFWLFDIWTPKGTWANDLEIASLKVPISYRVPAIYESVYDKDVIASLVDGNTTTRGKHIREGIVISHLTRRLKLKIVSNKFLEKDSK